MVTWLGNGFNMTTNRPDTCGINSTRSMSCYQSLGKALRQVVSDAEMNGWRRGEISEALIRLTIDYQASATPHTCRKKLNPFVRRCQELAE